jgi:hypothetical protein
MLRLVFLLILWRYCSGFSYSRSSKGVMIRKIAIDPIMHNLRNAGRVDGYDGQFFCCGFNNNIPCVSISDAVEQFGDAVDFRQTILRYIASVRRGHNTSDIHNLSMRLEPHHLR